MIYPENIKTRKSKLIYSFYKHLYVFERGKGDIIGRFTGFFTEAGVLYAVLKLSGKSFPWYVWALMMIAMVCVCYLFGYFFLKYNLDRIQNVVSMERNPIQHEVYDCLVKKKKEM